jgi:heterodisulfide reductase subunit C
MALESGGPIREKNILSLHKAFLASIRMNGRINEPIMMVHYKLLSGDLFSDMAMGLGMFMKGKLSLFSPKTRNLASVKKIFSNTTKQS